MTSFQEILQTALDRVPGARGAIFAAWDGEAVASVEAQGEDRILVLGAHYGVILANAQSILHLFHFGEAEEIVIVQDRLHVVLRTVADGYYVLLASEAEMHLATALQEIRTAATALRAEM